MIHKFGSWQVLERGWLSSNSIVFIEDGCNAIVDTGYCTHAQQTVSLVAHLLQDSPLDRIVNTHLHSDHCGGNAVLQAHYPKAQTFIPHGHSQEVATWNEDALTYRATGQNCPRFSFDQVLHPQNTIRLGCTDWEIHAAPGHDPHSIILFEPISRHLISADALWQNGFGVIFPELEGISAFDDTAASFDLIESLNPSMIIPGHGSVFQDWRTALNFSRKRLDQFVQNPVKHARYAAKVLLKYKLLELQQCTWEDLAQWHRETPYFSILQERYFPDMPHPLWLTDLMNGLARSGAARIEGDIVLNQN